MKRCGTCKIFKDSDEFNSDKSKGDGLCGTCKICRKEYIAQWQKDHPEMCGKNSAAWKQRNPHKRNATEAKRRSAKLQRTPSWLTELHFQQMEIFYDAASYLTKEFGIKMEVDHIVPLQGEIVSGLHVPWNLQVITERENCSKNNVFEGRVVT